MAERSSVLKTNWFRVKNVALFREFLASVPGHFDITLNDSQGEDGYVRFAGYDEQPGILRDPETDEELKDFEQALAEHLMADEVAVIVETVHTDLTHVEGYICAINTRGVLVASTFVDDFYTKLKDEHGVTPIHMEQH